jgi:hypothetical protein
MEEGELKMEKIKPEEPKTQDVLTQVVSEVTHKIKRRRVVPTAVQEKKLAECFEEYEYHSSGTEELGDEDSETGDEASDEEERENEQEMGYMEKFFNREFMQHTRPFKNDDEFSTPMLAERCKSIVKRLIKSEPEEKRKKRLAYIGQNLIMIESRVMQMRQALMQMRLAVELHQFRASTQVDKVVE